MADSTQWSGKMMDLFIVEEDGPTLLGRRWTNPPWKKMDQPSLEEDGPTLLGRDLFRELQIDLIQGLSITTKDLDKRLKKHQETFQEGFSMVKTHHT